MSTDALRATFVMEQHLGHESYARNLRTVIDRDDRITARWVGVDYDPGSSRLAKLPALPRALGGPFGGRAEVAAGLRDRPEVAFFNTQVAAALALPGLLRLTYVVATDITPLQYDRMAEHYGHRPDRIRAVAAAKHAANRQVFGRAERVVCWSNWCADSVTTDYGVAPDRVEVIAPGVDLELWRPGAARDPKTATRILFVGGDLERKGGLELVRAFGRLPAGRAELHLVTRSAYHPTIDGVTVHRDLTPNSPELVELFRSSDIFALPSQAEAFGIAAAEASACGLPVVASDSGGLTDIVCDGVTGFAVAPESPGGLADRLTTLVEDDALRSRMGAAARERAEQLFDAETNGRRMAELLLSVARRTG